MPPGSEDNKPQTPPACSDDTPTPTTTTTPTPTLCPIPVCSYTNPDVGAILVHCNQPHVPCPRWGCPVRTTPLKRHLRTAHLGDEKSIQNYPPIALTPLDLEILDWIFVRNRGSWEGTAEMIQLALPHLDYRRVDRLIQRPDMLERYARLDIEKCNAALDEKVKVLHEKGYMRTEEEIQELYFGCHPPAGCTPNTIPSSSTSGTP